MIAMINPKDSEKTIKFFSFRLHQKLYASGANGQQISDIEQEMWIVWCKARDAYNPEKGASFKTFLINGMNMRAKEMLRILVGKRFSENFALSLDHSYSSEDGDGATLSESVPSADPTPEELLKESQSQKRALERLSPKARMFVALMHNQPAELLAERDALVAKGEYARNQGIRYPSPQRLTSSIVLDFMGVIGPERTKVMRELESVGERLTK